MELGSVRFNGPSAPTMRTRIVDMCRGVHPCSANAGHEERRMPRFPGCMPVTFGRRHLDLVTANGADSEYVVLEKTDGVRYFLYVSPQTGRCFLVDRHFDFYQLDCKLLPTCGEVLLDGELVLETAMVSEGDLVRSGGTGWTYLVYDAMRVNGDPVASAKLHERLRAAETAVKTLASAGLPCAVRLKKVRPVACIAELFQWIHKMADREYVYVDHEAGARHSTDGVIFVPVGRPYVPGTCDEVLKWKFPATITVDYELRVHHGDMTRWLYYQDDHRMTRYRKISEARIPSFRAGHGAIVECAFDAEQGEWEFVRERRDKDRANFSGTVIDALESISQCLDIDRLVEEIGERTAFQAGAALGKRGRSE